MPLLRWAIGTSALRDERIDAARESLEVSTGTELHDGTKRPLGWSRASERHTTLNGSMAIMLCLDHELAFEACIRLDSLKAAPCLGELMEERPQLGAVFVHALRRRGVRKVKRRLELPNRLVVTLRESLQYDLSPVLAVEGHRAHTLSLTSVKPGRAAPGQSNGRSVRRRPL